MTCNTIDIVDRLDGGEEVEAPMQSPGLHRLKQVQKFHEVIMYAFFLVQIQKKNCVSSEMSCYISESPQRNDTEIV